MKRSTTKIIGVTGSVGKTSTKEAIKHALSPYYKVHCSKGNLNTEFGLCLSILGFTKAPKSKAEWPKVVALALGRALRPFRYDYAVFEYGVDRPGDMSILTSILSPDIAVFTRIAPVHMGDGQFASIKDIWDDKKQIAAKASIIITNSEDPSQKIAYTHSYGKKKGNVTYDEISDSPDGLVIDLHHQGKKYKVSLPHLFGTHMGHSIIAAMTVAAALKLPLASIGEHFQTFTLPPGRMNKLEGLHGSTLIDSSYNASPVAMEAALETLKGIRAKRKIAVLGTMNELDNPKMWHRRIGKIIGDSADILIAVGRLGYAYVEGTEKSKNPPKEMHQFLTAEHTGEFLKTYIQKDDVVLFKGSQNDVWLERAIKHVMKNPKKAASLLVRQ